ncbi:MAG: four-carbon acid sugar kinase family protein [Cyanobacteriota bacterium]|nr:four-carbon acid sugar kinase family protein [Cyanobacteriota bacterium]
MEQAEPPAAAAAPLKVIVLDDDPTGSQTLHSCPLLLRWDRDCLRRGLAHPSPFLFLLANTRALDAQAARERVREICRALLPALAEARRAGLIDHWLIVSRGDSTLRGHTPLELETIAAELATATEAATEASSEAAAELLARITPSGATAAPGAARQKPVRPGEQQRARLNRAASEAIPSPAAVARGGGPASGTTLPGVDACLLVPAFLPGGRTTRAGIHRLNGEPVHTSAFARDHLFGYSTSHLPTWLEEKSGGRIRARDVQGISLAELDAATPDPDTGAAAGDGHARLCQRLASLAPGTWVAVDAERPQQLAALGAAVRELTAPVGNGRWGRPRRFLFQSAASLLNGLAAIGPQPLDSRALAGLRRRAPTGPMPGLVLVGSHVPLADRQLQWLLAEDRCCGIELAVSTLQRLLAGPRPDRLLPSLEAAWLEQLQAVLAAGRTPVLFTSRGEVSCARPQERIELGLALAALMARLAGALAPRLGYLISKGGITTHTLLADGLGMGSVELQGQLLPGLSLVLAGEERLPVLTFPGNLGDDGTLRQAWREMEAAPAGSRP